MSYGRRGDYPPPRAPPPHRDADPRGGRAAGGRGGRVLQLTVCDDTRDEFSCKLLDRVMSKCGQPLRMVLDRRRDPPRSCAGFVMMETAEMAERCVSRFSGREIITGRLLLTLKPSHKEDLNVSYNNDMSWDYERTLPPGPGLRGGILDGEGQRGGILDGDGPAAIEDRRRGYPDSRDAPGHRPDPGDWVCERCGNLNWHDRDQCNRRDCRAPRGRGGGRDARDGDRARPPPAADDDRARHGPVILIHGILRNAIDPRTGQPAFTMDNLEKLLGLYGDVLRMKLMPSRIDTDDSMRALVEFRRPAEAENAVLKMNQCPLFGTVLSLSHTDKEVLKPPLKGVEDPDFKDFQSLSLGRFGPKFDIRKLVDTSPAPSSILYITSLPTGVTDSESMERVLAGYNVQDTTVFSSSRKNDRLECRARTGTVEEATELLVGLHGALMEGHDPGHRFPGLRITYSGHPLKRGGEFQALHQGRLVEGDPRGYRPRDWGAAPAVGRITE